MKAALLLTAFWVSATSLQAGRAVQEADIRAAELAAMADRLALRGEQSEAVAKYRSVVRAYPQSLAAPHAQLQIADLLSANREYSSGFEAYQSLIDQFPASSLFTHALEGQFAIVQRIAESQRQADKKGVKPAATIPDRTALTEMLRRILGNARHASLSPKLQYQLSVALDRAGEEREAAGEFARFLANYGDDPLADDAAFQIGFLEYRTARDNNLERSARERATVALEYFLSKFPESEKAPEAAHLLGVLKTWNVTTLTQAGKLYEKTGKSEAALKTYGEALESADDAEARRLAEQIKRLKQRMR